MLDKYKPVGPEITALNKVMPWVHDKAKLATIVSELDEEEVRALKEEYIPSVAKHPDWEFDQEVSAAISPLLN